MDNKFEHSEKRMENQQKEYTLDLIIPTYKPDEKFDKLLDRLSKQRIKPKHIYIINTEEKYLEESRYNKYHNVSVIHI